MLKGIVFGINTLTKFVSLCKYFLENRKSIGNEIYTVRRCFPK